ncbi:hypothetical protein, partial [Streptomyces sp. NPDC000188]|uniref:hypothetical protein n=1 Tax=Streptomyces sp. NPDC000188 TaxID=3154245 RepID=UPI0033342A65
MRPVDPRLSAYARTTRAFLAGSVVLSGVGAALLVAQASLVAEIVVPAFKEHAYDLTWPLLGLVAVALGRALVAWLTELAAHRSVARVKSTLRGRLPDHATALGPSYLTGRGRHRRALGGPDRPDHRADRRRHRRAGHPGCGRGCAPGRVSGRRRARPLAAFEAVAGMPTAV